MKKKWFLFLIIMTVTLLPGAIRRVSLAWDGQQANGNSYHPAISEDGRFVAFESDASNLVPGDTNSKMDVFVRDLLLSTTIRVSVANDGSEANGGSWGPSISADGRLVVFVSRASNLVVNDKNQLGDVFVRNLQTGVTIRVSLDPEGKEFTYYYDNYPYTLISKDGRWVLFSAYYKRPGDSHENDYLFIRDLAAGSTRLFGYKENGLDIFPSQYSSSTYFFCLSTDRRYLSFNSDDGIALYDFSTGAIASFKMAGTHALSPDGSLIFINGASFEGMDAHNRFYDDGNYVFFSGNRSLVPLGKLHISRCASRSLSDDSDYVPVIITDYGVWFGYGPLYMFNWKTGEKRLISRDLDGQVSGAGDEYGVDNSVIASLALGGRVIAFYSKSSNLVKDDTNDKYDIFLNDDAFPLTFSPTIQIGGRVTTLQGQGLPNVSLTYAPSDQTWTDDQGRYTFNVQPPWSGTITPHHPFTQFVPEFRSYENVGSDIADADFSARTVSVSISVQRRLDRSWLRRLAYNVVTMAIVNETSWRVTGLRLYRKETGKTDLLLKIYGPADLQNNQAIYRDDAITRSQSYQYYFVADLSNGETLTSPIGSDQPANPSREAIRGKMTSK